MRRVRQMIAQIGNRPSSRRQLIGFSAAAILGIVAFGYGRPAFALTLNEARNQGLVGERLDGYIGVVRDAAGVRDLVQSVNAQRRAQYERTAADTGRPLSEVEAVAGQTLIDRAQSGWYVMNSAGNWVQK